jgi:acetyl esterase/lipase
VRMRRVALILSLLAVAGVMTAAPAAGDRPFVATLAPAGPVRGVVIGVHGGAWYGVGRTISFEVRDDLERWRRQGWLGVIVDYPAGGAAPASVLAAYDKLRARYGAEMPICLYGESAGAQLALTVAAARRDVACVETAGAPTDLTAIDPHLGSQATHADRNARRAFPGRQLAATSPIHSAARIHARLLLAHLRTDPVIGVAHSERLAAAVPSARLLVLEPGPRGWVHGGVSAVSFAELEAAERELMAAGQR